MPVLLDRRTPYSQYRLSSPSYSSRRLLLLPSSCPLPIICLAADPSLSPYRTRLPFTHPFAPYCTVNHTPATSAFLLLPFAPPLSFYATPRPPSSSRLSSSLTHHLPLTTHLPTRHYTLFYHPHHHLPLIQRASHSSIYPIYHGLLIARYTTEGTERTSQTPTDWPVGWAMGFDSLRLRGRRRCFGATDPSYAPLRFLQSYICLFHHLLLLVRRVAHPPVRLLIRVRCLKSPVSRMLPRLIACSLRTTLSSARSVSMLTPELSPLTPYLVLGPRSLRT